MTQNQGKETVPATYIPPSQRCSDDEDTCGCCTDFETTKRTQTYEEYIKHITGLETWLSPELAKRFSNQPFDKKRYIVDILRGQGWIMQS